MKGSRRATLIGTFALLLWSSLAILTTATGHIPPFELVAMGFPLAALASCAKWFLRGESPLEKLHQPLGAWVLGVGGLFLYHALYFAGLRLAPPLTANLLNYLWPLLIILMSALAMHERLKPRHLLAGLAGLFGTALLLPGLSDMSGGIGGREALGCAAAIAAALVWSSYSVLNRRYQQVPSDAVGGFCAVAAILALICHLTFEVTVWPQGWQWAAIAAMGLGPLGIAFFAWDYGCKHGNIRALGTLAYLVPLLSNALLIGFGKGELTGMIALAALLIIGGAIVGADDLIRAKGEN